MELAVHLFLSLDGVYTSPGAPDETPGRYFEKGGWVIPFSDEEFGSIVDGWFAATDALLLGRTTYEIFAGFWPQVTDPENAVAARLNGAKKYVVSNSLSAPGWANTTVLDGGADGGALAAVRRLREAPGGELQVHGSGALARSLHAAGLIDVYRLVIAPVVLGDGERLFDTGCAPSGFEVVSQRTTGQGLTYLELRPATLRQAVPTVEDGREVVHAL